MAWYLTIIFFFKEIIGTKFLFLVISRLLHSPQVKKTIRNGCDHKYQERKNCTSLHRLDMTGIGVYYIYCC